jgi:hypothetical protein
MTPSVPSSDTGTATAGITVAQTFLRKTKMTRMTRTTVIRRVICISSTEARMVVVRSDATSTFTAAGMDA